MSDCEFCKEELNAMPFLCPKCGGHFCSKHKFPKNHECKKIDSPVIIDEGIINREEKEKENSKYIEEEVTIIKRRLNKPSTLVEFLGFLWRYNLVFLILILVGSGIYIQKTGIYDIKAKLGELAEVYGLKTSVFKKEAIELNESLKKIAESDIKIPLGANDKTLIERIQENPRIYIGKEVVIESFIEWSEKKIGSQNFKYRAKDDNGKYLYFTFFQNVGFNNYNKYKIIGVVKNELDTYYIDAKDITKI